MFRAYCTRVRLAVWVGAVVCLLGASGVQAQMMQRLNLDQIVEKSDNIFVATCTDKKVVWQNGNVVTKYKLRVTENWKGKTSLSSEGLLEMEEMGGAVDKPVKMTQYLPGMANIAPQEEVLLFAQKASFDPKNYGSGQKPLLSPNSLMIVGRNQGRYTIVRHPESGERMLSRVGVQPLPNSMRTPLLSQLEKINTPQVTTGTTQVLTQRVDMAERRRLGARLAQAQAAAGDNTNQIMPFEGLASVKTRVAQVMQKQSAKP